MRKYVSLVAVLAIGCGPGIEQPDASSDGALQHVCTSDAQCADGRFCNGEERCDPSAPGADARGCLLGPDPCPGQRCDEAASVCTPCDEPDADGDGHDDYRCGGDDCDDSDPLRFPGAIEICDPDDRDEDCNPSTVGGDADGDGESPTTCCNVIDGTLRCGTDCDDTRASINTSAVEVCNGIDEDCDGTLDEGVPHTIYPDDDGDGFGRTRDGQASCTLPQTGGFSFLGGDCDDTDASTNPSRTEQCNGVDDDCDAAIDEGCPCEPGQTRRCGERETSGDLVEIGSCHAGDQICRERVWSSCIMATVPEDERCNQVDDDCDGRIDEGQTVLLFIDEDGDGFGNPREPRHACGWLPGYVMDATDCDDRAAWRSPAAVEVCDGLDQDCDERVDEGLAGCMGCTDGETRSCDTACGTGIETCTGGAFGGCTAPAPSVELCNGVDDDCDGSLDEELMRPCSSACGTGLEQCTDGVFGACTAPLPELESCNGNDDDCDGVVDEGFPGCVGCTDGETQPCSNTCGSGVETCSGGIFGGCTAPLPSAETCNGRDDDCDGSVDEGVTRSCSTSCGSGVETCSGGVYGGCTAPMPSAETCNGRDDDCDGSVDEGVTRSCSTSCGSGVETCSGGIFGGCTAPTPTTETCNGRDDDCDGGVDEALTRTCSTSCGSGVETCSGGIFGGCTAPTPSAETCNGRDDDCDGSVDEALTRTCSTSCGSGVETCSGGIFGGCTAPTPTTETCNRLDDDCDGSVDEGLECPLIPPMVAPDRPSGRVTSSGDYEGYPAWQAFDDRDAMWLSTQDRAPAWVAYEFTDGPRTVVGYSIRFTNGTLTSRAPRDWQLQGSNDGRSWVTLDSRVEQVDWRSNEERRFAVRSSTAYTHYRLYVTNDNDDRGTIVVLSIGELDLFGY